MISSTTWGADSPYQGSLPAEGTYYLYQVESKQWLQPNCHKIDAWTTHAELGDTGFDIELRKLDGFNDGFQIYCNFENNGELNGSDEDRFYLDQSNRQLTEWIFEPIAGTSNQFKILVKARNVADDRKQRDGVEKDTYIGYRAGDFGGLSDNPVSTTWQLVSREERIKVMQEEVKSTKKPADVSWLIPAWDRGRFDNRSSNWNVTTINDFGGSDAFGGSNGYPVYECWHKVEKNVQISLNDLPKGTYSFSVQAYYRDAAIEDDELMERYSNGTENLIVKYFAGASEGVVQSIFAQSKTNAQTGFPYRASNGRYVPNSTGDAANAMINGEYINEYIPAPVGDDGTITLGIRKDAGGYDRDWLIYKRFYLRYDGQNIDVSAILSQLDEKLSEANSMLAEHHYLQEADAFAVAIKAAKEVDRSNADEIATALNTLSAAIIAVNGALNDISYYIATRKLCDSRDIVDAEEIFKNAQAPEDYAKALTELRYARRYAAADKQEDLFTGNAPAAGEFYLYNVGRRQFLCGGSDWGAHAALGMPGVLITLEGSGNNFAIETGLFNVSTHHLNYRGYMDASPEVWTFVDAGNGCYNITNNGNHGLVWDPFAGTDAGNNDETNVAGDIEIDFADPNAQWKLVTKEEREALLSGATAQNPVDATFFVKSPNFANRESADRHWIFSDRTGIWEPGRNQNDFAAESYNTDNFDMHQTIEGLPEGVYEVTIQGYYRNGMGDNHFNNQDATNAIFYAGDSNLGTAKQVAIKNINEENLNAPGEGDIFENTSRGTVCVPNDIPQASAFFKSGLYRNTLRVTVKNPNKPKSSSTRAAATLSKGNLPLGVKKTQKGEEGDWAVINNVRLKDYGPETVESGVDEIPVDDTKENLDTLRDNKTYNLFGVEVKNPTAPGIYIRNGKKFIIR